VVQVQVRVQVLVSGQVHGFRAALDLIAVLDLNLNLDREAANAARPDPA
jgi:hypothetical protein